MRRDFGLARAAAPAFRRVLPMVFRQLVHQESRRLPPLFLVILTGSGIVLIGLRGPPDY